MLASATFTFLLPLCVVLKMKVFIGIFNTACGVKAANYSAAYSCKKMQ